MKSTNQPHSVLKVALLRVYLIYTAMVFILTFLLGIPIVLLAVIFKSDRLALQVNHYWAFAFFFLIGVSLEIVQKEKLDKSTTYIFCPNHFSFLDIAIMPLVPIPFKFVGKVSIAKVPLMGYIFKRFHITVDRAKLRDRYATYKKSISALLNGCSLTVFPEGGIRSVNPPKLETFKEGPFRMAIETGVQLVPVTLADNWHLFPDDGNFFFNRRPCRLVIHEPINPTKYTMETIKKFQEDVHQIIQIELDGLNA